MAKTLLEVITALEISVKVNRIAKLTSIDAPRVIIEGEKKSLAELEAGNIKIGGDASLLAIPYVNHEIKRGNGGKQYVAFNGSINYFPQAKYGRFIAKAQ